MKLERHVGGLSRERKERYLTARGWTEDRGDWSCERLDAAGIPLSRAVHHQLTEDLTAALTELGWSVAGFSPRGYVKLRDGDARGTCSLPKALRTQARREKRPVAELTYSLFLDAVLAATGEDVREEQT